MINDSLNSPKTVIVTSDNLHNATYAYKIGVQVYAYIYLSSLTLTGNTFTTVCTISNAPVKLISFPCVFIDVSNKNILGYGIAQINTDGSILIKSNTDVSNARCIINANYITN